MEVEIDHGQLVRDPDEYQIRDALGGMRECAIVSRSSLSFLRVSRTSQPGLMLEAQEGSQDNHLKLCDVVSLEEAAKIVAEYSKNSPDWRKWFTDRTVNDTSLRNKRLLLLVILAGALAALTVELLAM